MQPKTENMSGSRLKPALLRGGTGKRIDLQMRGKKYGIYGPFKTERHTRND